MFWQWLLVFPKIGVHGKPPWLKGYKRHTRTAVAWFMEFLLRLLWTEINLEVRKLFSHGFCGPHVLHQDCAQCICGARSWLSVLPSFQAPHKKARSQAKKCEMASTQRCPDPMLVAFSLVPAHWCRPYNTKDERFWVYFHVATSLAPSRWAACKEEQKRLHCNHWRSSIYCTFFFFEIPVNLSLWGGLQAFRIVGLQTFPPSMSF